MQVKAAAVTIFAVFVGPVLWCAAQEPGRLALPAVEAPVSMSPLIDDAGLRDVQLVGDHQAWAVGDRGAVWRSDDAGGEWRLVSAPVSCTLRSVCFLTNRVGWIVGGGMRAHGQDTYGVVLRTMDGGESWQQVGGPHLPLLHEVRFFDLNAGIAVGEASGAFPTGLLATADGGESWQPAPGRESDGWRCTTFLDPTTGFVAGRLGLYASVSGGQLQPSPAGARGLRGITDVVIGSDFRGWLVGDGGLVLHTETGGVSWRQPPGEIPRELREVTDYRAVATAGDSVWMAGQPGSVIWHSADRGQTWTPQPTGNPLPLEALSFSTPRLGVAVGAMGRIIRTTDGGATWETVRGAGRRAALLTICAHESGVSLNVPTKYANELGYRTVASVIARRDIGPDGEDGRTLDLRVHEALTVAGGAGATVDWAFPIAAPGLERDQRELVREWELLTDNRLREKMLGRLVSQLCVWRPAVVIVDSAAADDAATTLLIDAVRVAVREAADPALHPELRHGGHLPAWQVQRLFRRQPAGSGGGVRVDAFEFLPRLGMSLAMAAAGPARLLSGREPVTAVGDEVFVPVALTASAESDPADRRDLFTGLAIAPGSDARRMLEPFDDGELDRRQHLAERQRNFAAYAARMLDDPRHAAQLVAQTRDIVAGAPPAQAAVQLLHLAGEYRRRGDWELAQAVLVELAEGYPHEPPALEAMSWLLAYWASAEVSWQRLKTSSGMERTRATVDSTIVQANLQRAIEEARNEGVGEGIPSVVDVEDSPVRQTSVSGSIHFGGGVGQQAAKHRAWLTNAERIVRSLKEIAPTEFTAAGPQFQLAALHRKLNHPQQADEIYRSFINETADGPWNRIASGELWLAQQAAIAPQSAIAPQPVIVCPRVQSPPLLDGILDDECWQKAAAVALRTDAEHRQTTGPFGDEPQAAGRAHVHWACDGGFLYFAARIPREPSLPDERPELPGRVHDADLSRFDRLSIAIDTDRDYTTFYEIEVDQRGWSADACWENRTWNCTRYIAADADSREWRIEMALPFTELAPAAPRRGQAWAIGVTRVMPAVGIESWTHPAGSRPRPEGFGLLRFD